MDDQIVLKILEAHPAYKSASHETKHMYRVIANGIGIIISDLGLENQTVSAELLITVKFEIYTIISQLDSVIVARQKDKYLNAAKMQLESLADNFASVAEYHTTQIERLSALGVSNDDAFELLRKNQLTLGKLFELQPELFVLGY